MEANDSALDNLKDIPGFKAILRTVLKCQMQYLVEQMSKHVDEETIILTASVSDGSLHHQGSDTARGFMQGRDEIKSQFLGYCLKHHHKMLASQGTSVMDDVQAAPMYLKQRKRKFHHSTMSASPAMSSTSVSQHHVARPNNINIKSNEYRNVDLTRELANVNTTTDNLSMLPVVRRDETESPSYDSSSHSDAGITQSWTGTGDSHQSIEIVTDTADSVPYTIIKPEPHDEINDDSGNDASGEMSIADWAGPKQEDMGTELHPLNDQGSFTNKDHKYFANTLSATSSTEPTFPCKKCGKCFKTLQNMQVHDRQHTGVRPFGCDLCDKRFFQKSHLKAHVFMHSRELPHTCNVCGESFRWKSSLVNHKIRKHYIAASP